MTETEYIERPEPNNEPPFGHATPVLYNQNHERVENDLYETPDWVTTLLAMRLREYPFDLDEGSTVWEPACGKGKMTEALREYYPKIYATDLNDYGYGNTGRDFLEKDTDWFNAIITNPPFSLAEKFARHALSLQNNEGQIVAILLRHDWDCAKSRNDLFTEKPFWGKITLTTRPRWFEYKKGDSSPQHNYAWYIWLNGWTLPPVIEYGHKPKGVK